VPGARVGDAAQQPFGLGGRADGVVEALEQDEGGADAVGGGER